MEFRQLKSFIAVAHTLSFSRAAKEVHLSQPALSAQIQSLESDLGVRLLERNRRMVRLTPAGEALLSDAEAILQRTHEAAIRARQIAQGDAGHLRIGFVASAALELVPPIIVAFRKKYPKVSFELKNVRTVDQIEALSDNSLDAGFLRLPLTDPGLNIWQVHRESFALVMAKTHPLARIEDLQLSMFAEEGFIAYGRRWAPDFYDTWVDICTRSGFVPHVVQETAEMPTMLALVEAGVGVAIVPEGLARRHSKESRIMSLASDEARSNLGIAVCKANRDPLVRNLIAVALEIGNKG
jgi:DNA-binding transcriptional LysR family regulator